MSKSIAIIDDNKELRSTVATNLELGLNDIRSNLNIIEVDPFQNKEDYFNFIQQNDICVIILDEKLNDQPTSNGQPVDYKGSELVVYLRERLKELPIFALTVIPNNSELMDKYNQYEDIIERKDFIENTEKYILKIWRAAKNYLDENINELAEFNILTKEVAGGDTDPNKIQKLQALQTSLEIPFSGFDSRQDWIIEYEKQIKTLEELNAKIKSKLNSNDELETN